MSSSILALDVGQRRIGVAAADSAARLAHPLTTLINEGDITGKIGALIDEHNAKELVVGLPRGLDGQQTGQSKYTEAFVRQLRQKISVPIHLQDEAVTSRQAEAELKSRGKPYAKADIDALAATYILEDYLK